MNTWMTGGAVVLCGIATWWDLRHRRIPNGLTLPALGIALCLHGATGAGPGLLLSAGGALAAGALLLPGYVMRFTGAGDVKLLMAVGAFLSFPEALMAGLLALVLGGVLGLGSVRPDRQVRSLPGSWRQPIVPRFFARASHALRPPGAVGGDRARYRLGRSAARTWSS
jgi:Flp pilus assembly protein protease CpaA